MAGQYCDNCMYSVCDPELWRRWLWMGESIVPRCANHPLWPGQMHDVPGVPCRNYRPKPVLPNGDGVRLIPLGDGFYAYVDAADYEWLSRNNWRLIHEYAGRRERGRVILMHREIMQAPDGMLVDHADGNKANNCRFNLRICTPAENVRNQRKRRGSGSRFKGVYYRKKARKWAAECRFAGTKYYLGLFDDEAEAARAYDCKAVELFGEFARLNFPEEWPPQRRPQLYAQRDAAKTEGKRVGRKEGRTTMHAKPRAMKGERRTQGNSRVKTKGRKREDSVKIVNRKSSIINPKGPPGRGARRRTTKAKERAKVTRRRTEGRKVLQ